MDRAGSVSAFFSKKRFFVFYIFDTNQTARMEIADSGSFKMKDKVSREKNDA